MRMALLEGIDFSLKARVLTPFHAEADRSHGHHALFF